MVEVGETEAYQEDEGKEDKTVTEGRVDARENKVVREMYTMDLVNLLGVTEGELDHRPLEGEEQEEEKQGTREEVGILSSGRTVRVVLADSGHETHFAALS